MARRSLVVLSVLVLMAGLAAPVGAVERPASTETDASWIVILAPGTNAPETAPVLARRHSGSVGHVYENIFQGFEFRGSQAAADALRRNPNVVSVTSNGTVHTTEWLPNSVARIDGWTAHQAGFDGRQPDGTPVRIAILDTGINLTHVDLAPNLVASEGKNCIFDGPPNDDQGHGTHVAGSAAGAFNGDGAVGIATDASLAAVKVLDSTGYGTDADVICGLDHVYTLAADGVPTVINLSLGEAKTETADCASSPTHQAICNLHDAGVVVVAAAGNSAIDTSGFVPASYPETIAVSAFSDLDGTVADTGCDFFGDILGSCDETLANFTNFGALVDVAAPGVQVLSASINGGLEIKSGTSMASPHVAGVAALMLGANPGLTPEQVRSVLRETGECPDGTISGASTCEGKGIWLMSGVFGGASPESDGIPEPLVNALRAAEAAAGQPVDLVDPAVTITAPADGATILGTITVSADASDDVAVASVEFFVDGISIGVDTTEPYTLTWDSASSVNGPAALEATASDSSGNKATDSIGITIDNPPDLVDPTVTLTAPLDGATVVGSITVTADASDDVAVASVEFFVDGLSIGIDTTEPYASTWDTASGSNGSHTVSAVASDPTGNSSSDQASVTVDNPVLAEYTPIDGAVIDTEAGSHAETYDDDLGTFWRSASDFLFNEPWIYWDLGVSTTLTKINLYQSNPSHFSTALTIQFSDDAATWTQLPEGQYTGLTHGTWESFEFAEQTARYWRMWDTGHSIALWQIAEVEFWGPTSGDPDVVDPVVTLTAPADGATVSGATVPITADATDDVAVDRVEFSINGQLVATDTTAPYETTWDTTGETNGPGHTITATAYDTTGNTTTDTNTVTIDNPDVVDPTVTLTAPADGATVSGATVPITADATDDVAVDRVEFSINGQLVATDTTAPYETTWDTTGETNGPGHTITATAYDTTGNTTTDTNTVTIDNAAPPVPVDDTASSGSTLSGTTTGTIGDTLADDGVAFAITEEETGGKPSSRTSLLEQTWDFQVTGGEVVTFYVNAWASGSAEGETFGFSYTSDGGDTWVDMLTVSSTSDLGYQQFVLPPSVDGNVTVRVVDDDRSAGNRVLDTLLVDHMFFLSEPVGQGPAPAAPSLLTAVGGAGMVSLSWSDNASDELGYEVERRLPTGVWSVISALPADTTSFTDLGVVAGTTYEYRVHGYSAGGVSEYSPTSTATVEEVTIALTATGFKQRALQKVQLDWTGSDLVNILRDGAIVASNVSGSSWVDNLDIKGEGTYVYQVCDASSGACSNTATVVF